MRDLLFKNLTSLDKKRKIISSQEIVDKNGIRSKISRHFVYFMREVTSDQVSKPAPYMYVLKIRNQKAQREMFFCRIKGSFYYVEGERIFQILFMHSLKINLTSIPNGLMQYCED